MQCARRPLSTIRQKHFKRTMKPRGIHDSMTMRKPLKLGGEFERSIHQKTPRGPSQIACLRPKSPSLVIHQFAKVRKGSERQSLINTVRSSTTIATFQSPPEENQPQAHVLRPRTRPTNLPKNHDLGRHQLVLRRVKLLLALTPWAAPTAPLNDRPALKVNRRRRSHSLKSRVRLMESRSLSTE